MPSKLIDGVRHMMTRNIWRCKLCGSMVESRSRHDYQSCQCGNLSVDGGIEAGGTLEFKDESQIEDMCVWKPVK